MNAPVVEVVSEFAVARLEEQIALDEAVLQHFRQVEHVEVVLLGQDQCVAHQLVHAPLVVVLHEVVVGVRGVDLVVMRVLQD